MSRCFIALFVSVWLLLYIFCDYNNSDVYWLFLRWRLFIEWDMQMFVPGKIIKFNLHNSFYSWSMHKNKYCVLPDEKIRCSRIFPQSSDENCFSEWRCKARVMIEWVPKNPRQLYTVFLQKMIHRAWIVRICTEMVQWFN